MHSQKTFRLDGHRYELAPTIPQRLIQTYISPLSAQATDEVICSAVDRAAAASGGAWVNDKTLPVAYAFAKACHRKAHGIAVCREQKEQPHHA